MRRAEPKDARAVARLHKQEIVGGFLSTLPTLFLEKLYASFISAPEGFCFVAEDGGGEVMGFISGAENLKGVYKYFLRHYAVLGVLLLPRALTPSGAKRMLENVRYVREEPGDAALPSAELFSIAVKVERRGTGVSGELFDRLLEEFGRRGVKEFKIVVGGELERARGFYEKMGCERRGVTTLHGKETSYAYICST